MKNINNCAICMALDEYYSKDKCEFFNKVLYQNDDFVILPSIGPVTLGHVMIVSKSHYLNLSLMTKNSITKYIKLLEDIKKHFPIYKNNLLEAEHGPFKLNHAGCCVEHTHIHLIPNLGNYENIFKNKLDTILISEDIFCLLGINKAYILIRGSSKTIRIYDAEDVPTQFIRRLLFKKLGNDKWDWTTYPNFDLIQETIDYWENKK